MGEPVGCVILNSALTKRWQCRGEACLGLMGFAVFQYVPACAREYVCCVSPLRGFSILLAYPQGLRPGLCVFRPFGATPSIIGGFCLLLVSTVLNAVKNQLDRPSVCSLGHIPPDLRHVGMGSDSSLRSE